MQHSDENDGGELPIEELLSRRIEDSRRKAIRFDRHRRTITLPPEPTGIMVVGDPHVDNEGCDWKTLLEHIELAKKTPGVYGACVGDMADNWIGRLTKLYAEASIRASDGWRLSQWLLEQIEWLAVVGGNHDSWAHAAGVDPLKWVSEQAKVKAYAPDELRININWKGKPDLDPVIWLLRHDFSGRSWYHPTHGPHKEAMLDGQVHLLTAGHLHQWGVITTEQRHNRVTHAVRVRGYKRCDKYAMEKGFPEVTYGESCMVVLQPELEGPGRVQILWDLEEACDYITFLRKRKKSKK